MLSVSHRIPAVCRWHVSQGVCVCLWRVGGRLDILTVSGMPTGKSFSLALARFRSALSFFLSGCQGFRQEESKQRSQGRCGVVRARFHIQDSCSPCEMTVYRTVVHLVYTGQYTGQLFTL